MRNCQQPTHDFGSTTSYKVEVFLSNITMALCFFRDMAGHIMDNWDLWERTVCHSQCFRCQLSNLSRGFVESTSFNDVVLKNLTIYFVCIARYTWLYLIVDNNTVLVTSVFSHWDPHWEFDCIANRDPPIWHKKNNCSPHLSAREVAWSLGIVGHLASPSSALHDFFTLRISESCLMIPTLLPCIIMNILWNCCGYWLSPLRMEILHMIGW